MNIPDDRITAVDIPGLSEVFADSIGSITFDGQTLRVEFCVTRLDPIRPPDPPTAKRYPSCRLVLAPNAAIAFANQLQGLMQQLQKQGVVSAQAPENVSRH
ncbi:MAG: hypothetical protein HYU75_06210 [Betaproteobacteria bacterium]|nr:hypothetical protein [Betaproteobacteria bacterium]